MSMRIYRGFGFIATQQFIDLNSDIDYVRLANDDKNDTYFVGVVLEKQYLDEIITIDTIDQVGLNSEYQKFITNIVDADEPELWSDEKTRTKWFKKLKSFTPKLMVFVA